MESIAASICFMTRSAFEVGSSNISPPSHSQTPVTALAMNSSSFHEDTLETPGPDPAIAVQMGRRNVRWQPSPLPQSPGGPSAVDAVSSRVDHRSLRTGEIDGSGGDVFGQRQPAAGNLALDKAAESGIPQSFAGEVGFNKGGSDGIDGNAVLRPLDAQGTDELDDGSLGGAVDRLARDADQAGLAGNEDHPAPAGRDHVGGDGPGHGESPSHIGRKVIIPILRSDLAARRGALPAEPGYPARSAHNGRGGHGR